MYHRAVLIILVVLNSMVLLGQIWFDGAPPFARVVNVTFCLLALALSAVSEFDVRVFTFAEVR